MYTKQELISTLMDARRLLHKQETGKEVTKLDITIAHDSIDIVVDALIQGNYSLGFQLESKEAPKGNTQSILFPLKYWQEGSANWFICPPTKMYWLINFLDNLEGLDYTIDGAFVTINNGEFTPVDADGNESEESFDYIKLEWTPLI